MDNITRVELTTKIGCPCMCDYCAQDKILDKYNSNQKELTLENVKKYFETIPKPTIVSIAGFSEPLRAKEIAEIIRFLKEDGRTVWVFTTLYDVDKSTIRKVFSIPNLFVRFHLPDTNGYTNIKLTPELVKNYETAIRLIKINNSNYASCCWGDTPTELVHITRDIEHETDLRLLTDFAGNVSLDWLPPSKPKLGKIECGRCDHRHILPDGRISLCAQDWSLEYVIGDLNTQSYNEITKSEPYITYCANRLTEDGETLCRLCSDSRLI